MIWYGTFKQRSFSSTIHLISLDKVRHSSTGREEMSSRLTLTIQLPCTSLHLRTSGAFGVVILGQYRGTKVAVKRVLPPFIKGAGSKASLDGSDEIAEQKNSKITESHTSRPTSKNSSAKERQESLNFTLANVSDDEATDLESGDSLSSRGQIKANTSMSGSSNDLERQLNMRHVDNNALSILQTVSVFRNGSDTSKGSVSRRKVILRHIPMFMRWDAHSTRIREFHAEMRLISRLRVRMEMVAYHGVA